MSQNDNKPLYNSYCFIYLDNELVGYTHSHSEADAVCKVDGRYQWDFALMIKNKKKRENTTANYHNLFVLTTIFKKLNP